MKKTKKQEQLNNNPIISIINSYENLRDIIPEGEETTTKDFNSDLVSEAP